MKARLRQNSVARGSGQAVNLGEYPFLLMQAFELPGELMYRMAPGPRCATREIATAAALTGDAAGFASALHKTDASAAP